MVVQVPVCSIYKIYYIYYNYIIYVRTCTYIYSMIVFPMQNAFGVIAMVVQSTSIYYHKGVCHHVLYHL